MSDKPVLGARDAAERLEDKRGMYPLCKDCQNITAMYPEGTLGPYKAGMLAFCTRERDLIDGLPMKCEFMRSAYGGCQAPGYLFDRKPATIPANADIQPDMKPGKVKPAQCRDCPTPTDCYQAGKCIKQANP